MRESHPNVRCLSALGATCTNQGNHHRNHHHLLVKYKNLKVSLHISKRQVSLCAGCNVYEPWAALVVGAGGGFCFLAVHTLMLK